MITGREPELARLTSAVEQGAAVVVVGPAGVGKSTLCREALARVGPWRGSGALATLRWAPLLVFRRLLGVDLGADPDRVVTQVLRSDPGALLLDDLQWAHESSLDVTLSLVGRIPVLATVRSGDPGTAAAVARLVAGGFTRVDLGPLAPEHSAAVFDAAHPGAPPELRRVVLDQAGGNPLLLSELAAGRDASPTLVRALQARLADHPDDVRVAMERLSVLGRPVEPEVLGPGADALVAAGLAASDGGLVHVHHALLAEAVVTDLGDRADEVRRQLADLVGPAEGAFLLARGGDRAAARRRALAAVATTGRRVSAELMVLAVACAPDGELDLEGRLAAARALTGIGQPERALELCQVPDIEALPPLERGALRAVASEASWMAGRAAEFTELITLALEDLRGTRTAWEVEALAGSTIVQTRLGLDGRPALDRAREAVALADELGVQQHFARYRLASVLMTSGEDGWADLYRQVLAAAEAEGDHRLRIIATESLVLGEWVAGSIDEAVAVADGLHDEGAPDGFESAWIGVMAYGSLLALLAGQDRRSIIERFRPLLAREVQFRNRPYVQAAVAIALADLGRHAEATEVMTGDARAPAAPPVIDLLLAAVTGWATAEVAFAAGRIADAAAAGRAVGGLGIGDYPAAVNARLVGAHASLELGEPIQGSEPVGLLPAWAAAPHEWRGLVASAEGRHDDAVVHFDRAVQAWAGHDRRSELRAGRAAADAARHAGHPDAVARLSAVERRAVDLEVLGAAARARRSLRAMGVVRSSSRAAGVAGLTARQAEVLRRVGAGLTSAEIATELQVAVSTIDSLVRTAVRRLGVANRRAAAALVLAADDEVAVE
ncbi:MAG: LuxR family transcriptional regulator [Acidimicrobiales bacterium]|nr:LuxR family transcriptional regulator [Acidimicrobiales bacterium]